MAWFTAFRLSGRASVIVASPSSMVYRIVPKSTMAASRAANAEEPIPSRGECERGFGRDRMRAVRTPHL